jgi:hypothetical protein
MLQHALDDAIGPPPVLADFLEIAGQHLDHVIDLGTLFIAE